MRKLIRYLKDNDMTGKDLSLRLRVSQASISNWITKGMLPNVKIAVRLERVTKGRVSVYDWK